MVTIPWVLCLLDEGEEQRLPEDLALVELHACTRGPTKSSTVAPFPCVWWAIGTGRSFRLGCMRFGIVQWCRRDVPGRMEACADAVVAEVDDAVRALSSTGRGHGRRCRRCPMENFAPFDVDPVRLGLAVVIGHGRNRKGGGVLGWDGFQQNEPGTWERRRWAAGVRCVARRDAGTSRPSRDSLAGAHGRIGPESSPVDARTAGPAFAVFSCWTSGSAWVEVERGHGIRIARRRRGTRAELAVLWTLSDRAEVRAYTADRRQ